MKRQQVVQMAVALGLLVVAIGMYLFMNSRAEPPGMYRPTKMNPPTGAPQPYVPSGPTK